MNARFLNSRHGPVSIEAGAGIMANPIGNVRIGPHLSASVHICPHVVVKASLCRPARGAGHAAVLLSPGIPSIPAMEKRWNGQDGSSSHVKERGFFLLFTVKEHIMNI